MVIAHTLISVALSQNSLDSAPFNCSNLEKTLFAPGIYFLIASLVFFRTFLNSSFSQPAFRPNLPLKQNNHHAYQIQAVDAESIISTSVPKVLFLEAILAHLGPGHPYGNINSIKTTITMLSIVQLYRDSIFTCCTQSDGFITVEIFAGY